MVRPVLVFTVDNSELSEGRLICEEITKEYNLPTVVCTTPVAKVSAIGVGMRSHTGVAEAMFKALAAAKVNISAITTSEIKISCLIQPEQGEIALKAIHSAFELDD